MVAATKTTEVDAVVVGAGFAGLYMSKKLRDDLGMSYRVFEAGDDVGGTWYWNRYPGARCDSEAYVYCFSFDEDLLQEWTWSGKYPEQPEILKYLQHVADRFDLKSGIDFSTRVTSAHYDEATKRWDVGTDQGEHISAKFLITGIGCLSTGQIPDIAGRDDFKGDWYHTGSWPHEGVDFTGKRVGVIGTGSSGVQSIPVIAQQAEHLTVFQRTPQFMIPARHHTVDSHYLDDVKTRYDEVWEIAKHSIAGFPYEAIDRKALDATPEERRKVYEEAWAEGGFRFGSTSFSDIALDKRANDTAAEFVRSKIRETVEDQETAEKLLPRDHPYGSKRTLIDTNYFETYNRDNVELVDIRHSPIQEITPTGIRTEDAEYDLDIIVFATGFDAMTGSFMKMDIQGRNGVPLKDAWAEGPKTYLGLSVHDFPNLFMITGPGSPSVLSNMPVSIEQHVEWISDLLEYTREHGIDAVEADGDAQEAWVAQVNENANKTFFPLADSWYLGANIPGKPRVFMPYVGGVGNYRKKCDEVTAAGYEGFELSTAKAEAATT
ncbi:MAG: NAD(P)/FAD-dependent oxidoreductase [Chloroflexi bacterium]|nr:NAD(P)/FAD-dependent oxidoreductase [Chloroflexota bacterium]MDA1148004.1 NAD(P)/FAD-dependent oxidoreductase [Chloroflexota bacterium]